MNRLVRLAAALVPLLGLGALWATSHRTYQQGTEWEVPIEGYDPRDYLRGHYVEFTYDWPGIEEFRDSPPQMLCLEGAAPKLARVRADIIGRCAHPIRADIAGVYSWETLTRGRLYLGQDRARRLQQDLQDEGRRGIVTIRQREDGSFTPIAIRFRALTAAEQAERDAEVADPFAAPVIDLPASSGNPRP